MTDRWKRERKKRKEEKEQEKERKNGRARKQKVGWALTVAGSEGGDREGFVSQTSH